MSRPRPEITTSAMVTAFHRDAFTLWLESQVPPRSPTLYQPAGFLGAPPVGWQLTVGRTRFVYRVPEQQRDVFYVVLIERDDARVGLHSPLADMVRLLQLVQQSGAGIRWIRGHVEPTSDRPCDALTRERLLAFYTRYLTTVADGVEDGVAWYGGDLTTFSWAREKRKVREHRAARLRTDQREYVESIP